MRLPLSFIRAVQRSQLSQASGHGWALGCGAECELVHLLSFERVLRKNMVPIAYEGRR